MQVTLETRDLTGLTEFSVLLCVVYGAMVNGSQLLESSHGTKTALDSIVRVITNLQ